MLTCGHLFRDSQGKGRITVDLFGLGRAASKLPAELVSYDLDPRRGAGGDSPAESGGHRPAGPARLSAQARHAGGERRLQQRRAADRASQPSDFVGQVPRPAHRRSGRPAGRRPQRRRAVLQRGIRHRRLQRRRSAATRKGFLPPWPRSTPNWIRTKWRSSTSRRARIPPPAWPSARRRPRRLRRAGCRRRRGANRIGRLGFSAGAGRGSHRPACLRTSRPRWRKSAAG